MRIKRAKRCKYCRYCKKVLREQNKSGLCSFHLNKEWHSENKNYTKEYNKKRDSKRIN